MVQQLKVEKSEPEKRERIKKETEKEAVSSRKSCRLYCHEKQKKDMHFGNRDNIMNID